MGEISNHLKENRAAWDRMSVEFKDWGHKAWTSVEPSWGIFSAPESAVGMLPSDLEGKRVIELGCGTAYVSAWLARRGAHPYGIDNSPAQLANAANFQQEFGLEFPLMLGNAEQTPFPDNTFDIAVSEYGACIWCDSYKWIPEAARILRPGGELVFLRNSDLMMFCTVSEDENEPVATQLQLSPFGMHRFAWQDGSVEFHLPHAALVTLLLESGFEITGMIDVQAPEGSSTPLPYITYEWARQWPCEEIWKARKRPVN